MSQDASRVPETQAAGRVLVVGAGVAGIRAAIDLAEVGCHVTLIDASPAIGGILAKLDHQFPNNHCGMCRMLPEVGRVQSSRFCLRKGLFHDRIDILPNTTIQSVRGELGSFEVDVLSQARWIDHEHCPTCSSPCVDVCPVTVPDPFNHGLTRRKAIHRPVPHSLPDTLRIDRQACTRCGECVAICPEDAIHLGTPDETTTLRADAVILAVGTSMHRPGGDSVTRHLLVSEDVVTAIQFERLLSIAGPRRDHLARPSDGKPIQHVAWLQCVGSRDRKHGRDVCSTVCCMFAIKEAMLVRDIGIDATLFTMDVRGQGRDFHRNRERAERNGVRLIRSRVHDVEPAFGGGLAIRYFDQASGTMQRGHYDLLVLSTGQSCNPEIAALGAHFGWSACDSGYAPTGELDRVKSPVPGVFLAGSITGPTDIAESVTSATAAASEVTKLLVGLGRNVAVVRDAPGKIRSEDSRVLVLQCRCGSDSVTPTYGREDPSTDVRVVDVPCRSEGAQAACELLATTSCDRVVFAACHPHMYRRKLRVLAETAGFDPDLVRVVDARGSMLPVRMAVAALKATPSQPASTLAPGSLERRVLVIGGGLAGMRAALSLAQRNVEVTLVDRDNELGGQFATHPGSTFDGADLRAYARQLRARVLENGLITVFAKTRVVASQERVGGRDTVLRKDGDKDVVVSHGATILATGAHEATTTSYGYATSDRIVTQSALEENLAAGSVDPESLGLVAMIQCVDSRQEGLHDYCSRICCMRALRNAKRIRELNPAANVVILYRDMMTCGLWERDFTQARKEGVLFVTYDVADPPRVEVLNGRPSIVATDPILGRPLQLDADWLVLSTALESDASSAELARIFGVERDEGGFFQEADAKWRPVDTMVDGVYVAGTAHAPVPAQQVLAEAEAAAHRAFDRLCRPIATHYHGIARVHASLCARCGACIDACAFHARRLDQDEYRIVVDPMSCRGCGVCTATCPNGATRMDTMGERQVMEALDVALEDVTIRPLPREGMS